MEGEDTIAGKVLQTAFVHESILESLDIDFRYVVPGSPERSPGLPVSEDSFRDKWGVLWRKPPGSLYYDVAESPLSGPIRISDIVNHPWPDPDDQGYTRGLRDRAQALRQRTDCALTLGLPSPFVHNTQFLRGFEDWFMDLAADPKLAGALFDAMVEITSAQAANVLKEVGDIVDIVFFSDDLGFQTGPMVSPETYRRLLKPWHKRYFDTVRQHTNAFINFHSCGSIYLLLDDLIDLGVDVINPVQVAAKDIDSETLAREYGDRVCFWGGVDTQRILPDGSTEDVRAEVKRLISDFAPGGGYVLSAVHNIQTRVPVENIIAMFEAGITYGRYPV